MISTFPELEWPDEEPNTTEPLCPDFSTLGPVSITSDPPSKRPTPVEILRDPPAPPIEEPEDIDNIPPDTEPVLTPAKILTDPPTLADSE